MSHYSVLIVGDKPIADALAPFDENTEVDPYRDYVDEISVGWWVAYANSAAFDALKEKAGIEHREAWKLVWGEKNEDPPRLPWPISVAAEDGINPYDSAAVVAHVNTKWDDSSERYFVDEDGKRIYSMSTYNPKSKWDWYEIGGRWAGEIVALPGAASAQRGKMSWGWDGTDAYMQYGVPSYDIAVKSDIDFETMAEVKAKHVGEQFDKSLAEGKWHDMNYQGKTREQVVEEARYFHTYATLHNGEWVEPGRMGWFGMSSETDDTRGEYQEWQRKLIADLPGDTLLTVVDCHI